MPTTILIAEDDSRNMLLMKDVLELKGYHLLQAANGREAVERARQALPQLILMDMQMPVMDGFEAVRILKKDERTRAIPIWAFTSYAMPGDERRIREAGCDAYITKPVRLKDLLRLVQQHFESRNAYPGEEPTCR